MNLVGRGIVLGAVAGPIVGFLLSAGPIIISHFLPHHASHRLEFYPWPMSVEFLGFPGAASFFLPGMCLGGIAGMVLRRVQSRGQKPAPPPESDDQTWPPAPKLPNATE